MQEDVPTRPANHSPDDPEGSEAQPWLVSYSDDDDRDMTTEQIAHALQLGEIDTDTIVWRDGMAEWLPISQVPDLSHVLHPTARATLDKKRTVMGGFIAAQRPAEPPRPGNPTQLPRNTLIGTGVHLTRPVAAELRPVALGLSPKMPAPGVQDIEEGSELDVELLESVRPGPLTSSSIEFPKLQSQTETEPLPAVRNRGMVDGPISLDPDSIESLPSNALESVVAELPPARAPSAPHSIFEIDSKPPGSPPTQAPKATTSKAAPHPHPPRPPLRERSDSPAQYIESLRPEFAASVPPPRGNTFGKVVVFALLVGALGGAMFYLGRKSAPLDPVASTPPPSLTASSVDTAAAATTPTPSEAEPTATTSEPSATALPASEPTAAPPAATDPSPAAVPRAPVPQRTTTEVAQRTPTPTRDPAPPTPSPAPPPEPESTASFDTAAASAALNAAAANASSCRSATDPSGVANVTVTFATSGRATNAVINGPPFAGTSTGSCIASKMRGAKVPPFGGDRITVRKVVVIQ